MRRPAASCRPGAGEGLGPAPVSAFTTGPTPASPNPPGPAHNERQADVRDGDERGKPARSINGASKAIRFFFCGPRSAYCSKKTATMSS